MAKPQEPESFEVTEYSGEDRLDRDIGAIQEIISAQIQKVPSANVRVSFTGNLVKLTYHCYEMHLPQRIRQVESDSDTMLKETVKVLKKEFKAKTGDTLKLKELKELANYSVQKVSLNERYMYAGWKFFELG